MTSVAHLNADLSKLSTTSSSASETSASLDAAFKGTITEAQREVVLDADFAITAGERASPTAALKRARLLVGCYRARDFVDVETFVTGLVANLCDYPECVVNLVTDPKHGLPATNTFCPAIAEVVEACKKARDRIKIAVSAIEYHDKQRASLHGKGKGDGG